jgi:hypothetical protein
MITTKQEVMISCPDKNVPVTIGQPPMTPERFLSWRAVNRRVGWWIDCSACTKRHLVIAQDCFLQSVQIQP